MFSSLTIRPITEEDTDLILLWRNHPSVVKNFIYRRPFTREGHLTWMREQVATGKVVQFIVEADGEPVGSVYLRDVDTVHKKAEFGIFIGSEKARGKGYGTRATRLILKHAFEVMKLNRVFLRVFSDNKEAIRCYEKAGFSKEGLFREDVILEGRPYDILFMSILKAEWEGENHD